MLINGFTVAAQAINFLILAWLLKRFLYKPIIDAIDERQKGIAAILADAEAKKAEAQKERDDFQRKNETFDQESAGLLNKAKEDADAEHQRLLLEARKDADALRAKRQDALQTEQRHLSQDIRLWTQNQVFAIAQKTLTDLAGVSLEERMGEVFVQRVRALTGEAKQELTTAFKASDQTVNVQSAFDLTPARQSAIASAVEEAFAPGAQIRFETTPELVSGIELSTNGQKIAWSIADYLATLEKSIGGLLLEDANPSPKLEPKQAAEPLPSAPGADH